MIEIFIYGTITLINTCIIINIIIDNIFRMGSYGKSESLYDLADAFLTINRITEYI